MRRLHHIYPFFSVCAFLYLCFQSRPHGTRCSHEKAAGGGLEDETEVSAGDGEKLPGADRGAREEGTHRTEQLTVQHDQISLICLCRMLEIMTVIVYLS